MPSPRAATVSTASLVGDATRGKTLFDTKGTCASCHRVNGLGSRLGPDLSSVGATRSAAELQRALIDPNAEVQPQNRFYRITKKDGTAISGTATVQFKSDGTGIDGGAPINNGSPVVSVTGNVFRLATGSAAL